METVEIVGEASLAAFVRDNRYAVVHCWAVWNLHDVEMRKRLKELPSDLRSGIGFGEMNVDVPENAPLAIAHEVKNVSALISYRDGIHIQTAHGMPPADRLAASMRELLAETNNTGN